MTLETINHETWDFIETVSASRDGMSLLEGGWPASFVFKFMFGEFSLDVDAEDVDFKTVDQYFEFLTEEAAA